MIVQLKKPPDDPLCTGVTDAGADAPDDDAGDAGTDAGNASPGQPSSLVCPWKCTPAGGGGFDVSRTQG